uniref:Uncharacterized protein n=1 Tax=Nelumbo nucifera TaxID=4432 RepID=A0A822XG66_NELNU|nr:TPA_asm: hypothetical protein HUJ06_021947 [Nelumbo nucifera]
MAGQGSPFEKSKPGSLVSLCLGLLGRHFEDIILDLTEIAANFPPDIRLAMAAIARRRKLLNDEVIISLAESSWEILDISGSEVSDFGLAKVAEKCKFLRAVDISQCSNITPFGVSELVQHCRSLETLRCGDTNFISGYEPKFMVAEGAPGVITLHADA